MHDRGALPRTTETLYRPQQSQARTTGMHALLGYAHGRAAVTAPWASTRQGRAPAHNKDVCVIEEFYRDKDSLSRQTCPVAKKKKKSPPGFRVSQHITNTKYIIKITQVIIILCSKLLLAYPNLDPIS